MVRERYLFYDVEAYEEAEAPFGIAYKVTLYDNEVVSDTYRHIYNNEICGYCKCLEDLGFVEIKE